MIETVLGAVDPSRWGATSFHDHVLADSSRLQRPGTPPGPTSEHVTIEDLGYLRWNFLALGDNLRLDDAQLAVTELARAVAAGLTGLVEASSWGLGPRHAGLPDISRRSGMQIVCSYGAYIPRTHPESIATMDEKRLEALFIEALQEAVPGTDFRAGLLGIMGTTGDLAARELEMLRAAARAASVSGAAMTVRLEETARRGLDVLRVIEAEGLPASRVVFTNADEYMDAPYWDELTAAGAVLEMCFGTEAIHRGRIDNPSDHERLPFFVDFLATHPTARFTLGQSVWTKAQLRRYGGYGYAHLMSTIVPELRSRGVPADRMQAMLVDEPRRLLDRG